MNTKELFIALIEALKENKHERAKAFLPLIGSQITDEYPDNGFGPAIPEDVFLLLNTPEMRGLVTCGFLALLLDL